MFSKGYTTSQVASVLGCSKRQSQRMKKLLAENLGATIWGGDVRPATIKSDAFCRVHAQKFRIEIIFPTPKKYILDNTNRIFQLDENHIHCYPNCILVQSNKKEFLGKTEEEALNKSMVYWYKIFLKLEHNLGVHLIKDRKQNISMTYFEIATSPCGMAEECEKRDDRVRIFSDKGKLRYTTDWSFNHEREAHGRETALKDSKTVNEYIKDILDNKIILPSELANLLKASIICNHETASGLSSIVKFMESQLPKEPKFRENIKGASYIG